MTVIPGEAGSAELTELPDPVPAEGELLVEPLYLGVEAMSHNRIWRWCAAPPMPTTRHWVGL